MKARHPHIWLYQPEIPQNTGTIARLCAATACRLHIVGPTVFDLNDRNLKRAGLDYWPYLDLEMHRSIQDLWDLSQGKYAVLTKFAKRSYLEIPQEVEHYLFGGESKGLPKDLIAERPENCFSLPMPHPGVRSLNLANTVSVMVYAGLRHFSAG